MMYDYNTTRPPVMLKEYGRNIQKIMDQIAAIEDKELRTKKAHSLIKLMETMVVKSDFIQKRWDDLFILSDYQLDINSSYPMPLKKDINQRDFHSNYRNIPIKYKYYGRNIELLVHKAAALTCPKEQGKMIIAIAKLMRRFSQLWNNEYISLDRIIEDIQRIAPHKIDIDVAALKATPSLVMNGSKGRSSRTTRTTTPTSTNSNPLK